jgi:hypothetical protein
MDRKVLGSSYATTASRHRPVLADERGKLRPIASYDPSTWTEEIAAEVQPVVKSTDDLMHLMYPDRYATPAGYQ